MRRKVVVACDYSMPHWGYQRTKHSMYRWNDQLSILCREYLIALLRYTGSKGDSLLHVVYGRQLKHL